MRMLVCGGRDFGDFSYLEHTLNKCRTWWNITTVITGGAKGADTLAERWAMRNQLELIVCLADWTKYGKAAGMIRNKEMLQHAPDVVVAFPGGAGTENMIRISRQAGVPVFIV